MTGLYNIHVVHLSVVGDGGKRYPTSAEGWSNSADERPAPAEGWSNSAKG